MENFASEIQTARLGETHLFFTGQAGYIIKSSSGQLLAIDLYLSECVERIEKSMGFKRLSPKILGPFDLEFDYVIATHPHMDHFDMDSIPEIMSHKRTRLFCSVGCEKLVDKLDMPDEETGSRITYVRQGDNIKAGDFEIHFVPCDHGSGAPDAVGVVVRVDGKTIYETGDTCLRLDWIDEIKEFGKIDIMIAPINGAFGNLDEMECAWLSHALKPGLTIPCHYGMFASHGGNPGKFFDIMKSSFPENKIFIMCAGEKLTLSYE